jgi:hypothetical protein
LVVVRLGVLGVGVARFGGEGARPYKDGTQDAGLKARRYKDPGAEEFLSSRTPFGMTGCFFVWLKETARLERRGLQGRKPKMPA